jgi:ribosomal protein S18 acetylase RimI-like enzyme
MTPLDSVCRRLRDDEFSAAGDLLTSAFADDPLFAGAQPDHASRPSFLAWLFPRLLVRNARAGGQTLAVWDAAALTGIACWRPAEAAASAAAHRLTKDRMAVPDEILEPLSALGRHEQVLAPFLDAHASGAAHLELLAVAPTAQGTGLARRLVDGVADAARDAGLGSVLLETEQPANVALYRRLGFTEVAHVADGDTLAPTWVFVRPIPSISESNRA